MIYGQQITANAYVDSSGYTIADVYIGIFENGLPVNGNNCTVVYQTRNNGNLSNPISVIVPGQSAFIYHGQISGPNLYFTVYINSVTPASGGVVVIPTTCDLKINYVYSTKQSNPGVNDGTVTISAISSFAPILYSLNNVAFQTSPIFTGLNGGYGTAYAKDSNNCVFQLDYFIATVLNLLISDPSVAIGTNSSRWNAAFNPVVFTYQRKDFQVIAIANDSVTGKAKVTVNTNILNTIAGDYIYLNASPYNGVYKITSIIGQQLIIDANYVSGFTSGYVNINRLRPYYKVLTEITYIDPLTGIFNTIVSTNTANQQGIIKADISSFLQSLLKAKDKSNYTQINYRDDNQSASYTVRYAEVWQGNPITYIAITAPYYILYAARQIQSKYGGNLGEYVPQLTVANPALLAKWVTDFQEPAYSAGYPFDIGFIYSEALVGRSIFLTTEPLDINRTPIGGGSTNSFLLNDDGSFLLQNDLTKIIIASQSLVNTPISEHVGLNRLLINADYGNTAWFLRLTLKYNNGTADIPVTQRQIVRIDKTCDDQSVYMRWIGLNGSWNYYRFNYNQDYSLDVQNSVIIKRFVSDYESQDTIEDVISKSAGVKVKVYAEDLSVMDIKGLQSMKYSPKVQMLVSPNPVKWKTVVLNTATFSEYETRNDVAPFSVQFNLPAINIQTQ